MDVSCKCEGCVNEKVTMKETVFREETAHKIRPCAVIMGRHGCLHLMRAVE